jgi:oxygen-independent coproporphyrinogen-3 oxidase
VPAPASGGIYVHLPFCPYICPYCDFAKWPLRRSQAQRYLEALLAEITRAPAFAARTFFLGGGTPNTFEPEDIASVVRAARDRFAPDGFAEATIELNPDLELCAPAAFEAYLEAGIDRFSFGVQSLVAAELATLGRRHSVADVAEAVRRARGAGVRNISLDMIFAIPGQTSASWSESLSGALALEPNHISTYGLTVEEGTPFEAWFARAPGDFARNDDEAELYGIAIDTLAGAGFEQYEISNFARPGKRCAHNANYWANGDYLGLGVGAASYRGGERCVHTRDLESYCAASLGGGAIPGEGERLEDPERLGEAAMLALRTAEGVDVAAFAERYRVDFHEFYKTVIDDMRALGTLDVTPERVRLTRRGRFVANDVCGAFVTFAGALP